MNTQETIQEPIVDPPNMEPPKAAPGKINGKEYPQAVNPFEDIDDLTRIIALKIAFGGNASPPPGSLLG